jgi:hypothetical protein
MLVVMTKDNQFGSNGPQTGDELDVFSFRYNSYDDEVVLFAWWDEKFPGHNMYFTLTHNICKAVYS